MIATGCLCSCVHLAHLDSLPLQTSQDGPLCTYLQQLIWPIRKSQAGETSRANLTPENSGTGLQPLSKMQKPMQEVIPGGVKRYETAVTSFQPEQNTVSTADNSTLK